MAPPIRHGEGGPVRATVHASATRRRYRQPREQMGRRLGSITSAPADGQILEGSDLGTPRRSSVPACTGIRALERAAEHAVLVVADEHVECRRISRVNRDVKGGQMSVGR